MSFLKFSAMKIIIQIAVVLSVVTTTGLFIPKPNGFRLKRDMRDSQRQDRLGGWCRRRGVSIESNPLGCEEALREFCTANPNTRFSLCDPESLSVSMSAHPQLAQQDLMRDSSGAIRPRKADRSTMKSLNNLGNELVGSLAKRLLAGLFGDAQQGPMRDPSIQRDAFQNEADVNSERNLLDSMFETDVDLTVGQANYIQSFFQGLLGSFFNGGRRKRKIGTGISFALWERIPIPYQFDRTVSSRSRDLIKQAIRLWEQNTCVRWQENGPGTDRIEFVNGQGCSSYVGRTGGTQEISLYEPGCDKVGIASHEIGHSLGFFHEQNRPDQDKFVTVNYRNIFPTYYNNFVKRPPSEVDDYGVPYDYGSVMHYDGFTKAFTLSSNSYAIIAREKDFQQTMGQRNGPSFVDFKQINMAYCADECHNSLPCYHNGYPDPNNCKTCKCPTGFGGVDCTTVESSDPGCGGVLTATKKRETIGGQFSRGNVCNYLIQAPRGYDVKLRFRDLNLICTEPCSTDYVEMKTGQLGWEITGFRLCCRTAPTQTFVSSGNEMIVRLVAQDRSPSFTAEYWSDAPATSVPGGGSGPSTVQPHTEPPRPRVTDPPVIRNTFAPIDPDDDCECTRWSMWSACDYDCGGCGYQRRQRSCSAASKDKCHNLEKKRCNMESCGKNLSGASFRNSKFNLFYEGCCVPLVPSNGVCGGFANILDKLFQFGSNQNRGRG